MPRRSVKRRGGGRVQGFLEEDTWSIRGISYIQAFSPMCLVTVAFRLIHGFACAGILPSQYLHFSQFAGIGVIGSWYIQAGM